MALGVTAYSEAPFGAETTGDIIVYPLGIQLTAQENSGIVNIDVDVSVTGQALTAAEGTVLGSAFVLVQPTGQALTSTLGNTTEVAAGQQVDVTGFDLNFNLASSTHDTLTAFGEAPFATLSPATFLVNVEVEATTGGIVGTFPLPMSLGTLSVAADADTSVTGQAMTIQEGQITADDASAEVTGQTLTSNLGTAVGAPNTIASATGFALTMQEGQATADDGSAEVTGIAMTAALGTAVLDANTLVDLTGFALTMQEGQATATDSVARPTGIEMTMAEGSVEHVIWNPVNTGNAPIDPPGWKEVA